DSTHPTYPSSTSPAISVNSGVFVKLQLLSPGETAVPGTATGKAGAASAQTAGTAFVVTVNAVEANWNLVSSENDTVAITSSDVNAALPANAALVSGSKTLSMTLKTAGSATVTGSDVTHAAYPSSTSPSLTVNVGAFAKLQFLAPGETASPGSASG